jgi:hypothetical protein
VLDQLRRTITIFTFFAVPWIIGCSSGATSTSAEKQKIPGRRDRVAPLAEYEATLNPAEYDQDVEAIKKKHDDIRPPQSVEILLDTASVADEIVQGFRIQIVSSPNIDDANAARESAIERFLADSIYILFDPPVYKVRVGDFLTRFEANSRLQDFLEAGYRDAWIVPDRVLKRGRRP